MKRIEVLTTGNSKTRREKAQYLFIFLLCLFGTVAAVSNDNPARNTEEQRLSAIINEFRSWLGISAPVSVSIVEVNEYLVSVQRSSDPVKAFTIKFEKEFLSTLTEEELRAVIAHELGHVWIFTHLPYLQTEALANEKALQLVSRESLEKVYEKVWRHEGQKGTLQEFLAKVENSNPLPQMNAAADSQHAERAVSAPSQASNDR